jgi:hypothetical protein
VSYSEQDGQVILTLIKDVEADLRDVLNWLRVRKYENAAISARSALDRLNAGNPHYTPYRVEEKKGNYIVNSLGGKR